MVVTDRDTDEQVRELEWPVKQLKHSKTLIFTQNRLMADLEEKSTSFNKKI